jgi:hypothetical protein
MHALEYRDTLWQIWIYLLTNWAFFILTDATIFEEEEEEEVEEEEEEEVEEGGSSGLIEGEKKESTSATRHLFGRQLVDKSFGAKYQKRMMAIQKKANKNRDMNIMVMSRPAAVLGKQGHNVLVNKHRGTQKIQHQIQDTEGELVFETGKIDGHVEICVQSLLATKERPSRVALNITTMAAADENAVVDQPMNEPPLVVDPTAMYQLHTSHITGEMTRLHNRIREILSNAEYSRDVEVGFHQQSVSLNKAVRYWPAFRILILIVAGYMQVSYVLAYLKSRHYI